MNRRDLLLTGSAYVAAGCSTAAGDAADPAAKRRDIDASVDRALSQLFNQAAGTAELARTAKGVLVFPKVVTAGFLLAASYGEGALRKGHITSGYYSIGAASAGLLAGAQSKAMYLMFMTQEALQRFETSSGWTAGADASVVMVNVGADANVSTQTARQDIIGYVLTRSGFMGNLSIDGTKFNRLDL
ncbi:BPSL1445 family SYLF domain-containing lipoprotein [Eleftheria terrae]|uniref:BPSL1445 family SYLF domain-containing lipoprotein n=1 Tax=Eleftheria terrae TaxID=1597781 RepID=UPI00263B02A8|nr:YSC84-related protein [Eleftheria terrae]WKB55548.1 YSC84-related protein [Eleftheria terrae]